MPLENAYVQRCGICGRALNGWSTRAGRKDFYPRDGLLVTIGYSKNGWGYRENLIDFSDEVCRDCFNVVIEKSKELVALIQSMTGVETHEAKPQGFNFRRLLRRGDEK